MKAAVAFALALLGVLFIADRSYAAAITTEEFALALEKLANTTYPDSPWIPTEFARIDDQPMGNCYDTSCGWNTHDSVTLQSTVFMPDTCPVETYMCFRTDENVSMNAYEYYWR